MTSRIRLRLTLRVPRAVVITIPSYLEPVTSLAVVSSQSSAECVHYFILVALKNPNRPVTQLYQSVRWQFIKPDDWDQVFTQVIVLLFRTPLNVLLD